MTRSLLVLAALLLALSLDSCQPRKTDEEKLREFVHNHVVLVEPLMKAQNLADWNATATGDKKYYDESAAQDFALRKIRSNRNDFLFLKEIQEQGNIKDPLLQRQLVLVYNNFLKNQVDTTLLRKISEQQSAIALKFNTFRGTVDGKQLSDNEIRDLLSNERHLARRQKAWEASKQIAIPVAPMLIELVKLRNEAARQAGFENYYVMMLAADEQNETDILRVFDELKDLTDKPYARMKEALDASVAKKFGIQPKELYPWHYADPFFQEAPSAGAVNLDAFIKGKDVVEIARRYYEGIGLPVDAILKNSDLYPREGKYQHAYETDIDRQGDIRTMCNVADDIYWTGTILHELGHGVYSKNIDSTLPFLLRVETHTFMTEAIAILMERQAKNADWLSVMVGIPDNQREAIRKEGSATLKNESLIFSRWSQVMMRFERGMYRDPDQDLNKLWWDLVEEYQLIRRPPGRNAPDWAAKIHIAQYPCYYHNYMLGQLAASQILGALGRTVAGKTKTEEFSFAGNPGVGTMLKEKIFRPGASLYWDDLLQQATGERLTAKYFAEEFCGL
jgi:peptidyl-dipeptidase A